MLKEYAQFVELSRDYLAEGKDRRTALADAVDHCIAHGILAEFLKQYRTEVLGMLLEEFDVKKYERSLRAEGRAEGYQSGEQRVSRLVQVLLAEGRVAEVERAVTDKAYREQLYEELSL